MDYKEKVNKHPKYGSVYKSRHGNGFFRSKTRQHKLEKKFNSMSNQIWVTGVFYDEEKGRLDWFSNLWHRKYWRGIANRRVRHKKEFLQNGGYRKFFHMVLHCDLVHLISHDISMRRLKPVNIKMIDNKKFYDYVREVMLAKKNIENLAEKFSNSEVIFTAAKSITNLITAEYPKCKVDVDFEDVKNFFEKVKFGKIFIGESEKSAVETVENLLKKIPATKNLLVSISGDENKIDMLDLNAAIEKIAKKFPDTEIIWGVTTDETLKNKIRVVTVMEVI